MAAHMREVTQLLLEHRPEMPVEFVAEYYRHAARGSTPLMQSYQHMRRTRRSRAEFMEVLVAAYAGMEAKGGVAHGTISDVQFRQLLHAVCADFPRALQAALWHALGVMPQGVGAAGPAAGESVDAVDLLEWEFAREKLQLGAVQVELVRLGQRRGDLARPGAHRDPLAPP